MSSSTLSPTDVVETYFDAWQAQDHDRLRSILADDVTFDGPMGHETNADDCTTSLMRLASMTRSLTVEKRFVDGPDVVTVFELQLEPATLSPVMNWSRVQDGKIVEILVTFDPRPLLEAG
jgi:ketosteroid isomerase-like protein